MFRFVLKLKWFGEYLRTLSEMAISNAIENNKVSNELIGSIWQRFWKGFCNLNLHWTFFGNSKHCLKRFYESLSNLSHDFINAAKSAVYLHKRCVFHWQKVIRRKTNLLFKAAAKIVNDNLGFKSFFLTKWFLVRKNNEKKNCC